MSNVLLGCAIGDALGVFAESQEPDYEPLIKWDGKTYVGSEYHGLKPGMYSDDTQFSLEVAQSLIENNGFNPDDLAKRYVNLFTSGNIRGYGRTTKMAIDNLIAGKSYTESGVPHSYGNGTFMRAASFGVFFKNDIKSLKEAAEIDAKITHNSAEAIAGSLAISILISFIIKGEEDNLLDRISSLLPESEVKKSLIQVKKILEEKKISSMEALKIIGTKADVRQSVPAVFYCYLKYDHYLDGCDAIIRAGFDTDTGAAALCSLYGAKPHFQKFSTYHMDNVENKMQIMDLDKKLFDMTM